MTENDSNEIEVNDNERYIVLDTETTGLSPTTGERIVEIGAVEVLNGEKTGKHFHVYINPDDKTVSPDAFKVHGISDDFLKDKPKFNEIADDFFKFIKDKTLVIHNAEFDVGFINAEFNRLNLPELEQCTKKIICSLQTAKALYPKKKVNLDALCTLLDVDKSARTLHGALLDAELLADVFVKFPKDALAAVKTLNELSNFEAEPIERVTRKRTFTVISPSINELELHQNYALKNKNDLWDTVGKIQLVNEFETTQVNDIENERNNLKSSINAYKNRF